MAVGLPLKTTYADGDVYSASDVNDTNGTVNLIGQTTNFFAGKNRIINGDFRINQRNLSSTTSSGSYGFDRWVYYYTTGTTTYSAEAFTLGAAPVAGYEGTNFARILSTGQTGATANIIFRQFIESVRTFAGQTVTLSFWAKAASGTPKVAIELGQSFGTGGSPSSEVNTYAGQVTLSTSWARYSVTVAIPSISGKTIGTNNNDALLLNLWTSAGTDYNARTGSLGLQNNTFDFWGMQLEAGSTATAFQTATGTIQGELAACQRYYWNATTANNTIGAGVVSSATNAFISVKYPQTMRIVPTLTFATAATLEQAGSAAVTAASIAVAGTDGAGISCTSSGMTTGRGAILYVTTGSFQFSSEL
jgi:hypothetical protein